MITIKNTQRKVRINTQDFKAKAEFLLQELGYDDFDLGVWFTTNKTIRTFNRDYRHKDKPTDIISFPFYPNLKAGERIHATSEDEKNIGDIIISLEYVVKEAQELGFVFQEWLDHILVHGICHLLGHDHYTEEKDIVMTAIEQTLLKKLKQKFS